MKRFPKIIALLLALVMSLSVFVGCGDDGGENGDNNGGEGDGGDAVGSVTETEWKSAFNITNYNLVLKETIKYGDYTVNSQTTNIAVVDSNFYYDTGLSAGTAQANAYLYDFADYFSSFKVNADGDYVCSLLTVDGIDYKNLKISFDENKKITVLSYVVESGYSFHMELAFSDYGTAVVPVRPEFEPSGSEFCTYRDTRDTEGHKLAYVTITIKDYGDVKLLLDATTAPETVMHILKLINEGFYEGLTFHRVIDNFMIQGGCPDANGTGNYKDSDGNKVTIKGEFPSNGHENDIKHIRGVISMARGGEKNSASSQFFICNADASWLDGDYAAFGYVIDGMSVVDRVTYDTSIYGDSNGAISDKTKQAVIERIVIDELVGIELSEIGGGDNELPPDTAQ